MKKKNMKKLNRNVVIPAIAVPVSVALGVVITTKIVTRINTVTDEEKEGFAKIVEATRNLVGDESKCYLLQATYAYASDEIFDDQYTKCTEAIGDMESITRIYVNNGSVKAAANELYGKLDEFLPLVKARLEEYKEARKNGPMQEDERPQAAEITGVAKEVSAQESSDKITDDDGEKIVEPEDESSDFMKLYTGYKKVSKSADGLAETLKNL